MPTYDITHKCGCTVEKTVCGTTRERSNKIAWLERQICWKCERDARKPYVKLEKHGDFLCIEVYDSFKIKDILKERGYSYINEFWRKTMSNSYKQMDKKAEMDKFISGQETVFHKMINEYSAELDFLMSLGVEEKETYEKGVIVETIKHYEGKYNGSKKEEHASCVE